MNKRFHLIIAVLISCFLIDVSVVYGQNALNRSFNAVSNDNSKTVEKKSLSSGSTNYSTGNKVLSEKLGAVLLSVKNSTGITVLVPNVVPQSESGENFCVSGNSNRDAYIVIISEEPECAANASLIASFTAERGGALPDKSVADKVITLANGIEGFYTAKSCGAACAPPQIEFVYEGTLYTFQLRSAGHGDELDEAQIVGMINSALNAAEK